MTNPLFLLINLHVFLLFILSCKPDNKGNEDIKNEETGTIYNSELIEYKAEIVVSDLEIPWGMAWLPNGDMLVTERSGTLHVFSNGILSEAIEGLPDILSIGQGGLMDIELHPDYENNAWIYFSYSSRSESNKDECNTAIMRARLENNKLVDQEKIFQALPYSGKDYHFGSRLEFDRDGYLYFSVGDRGDREVNPQSLENHCGKIHRIFDDGSIPPDNPFVNTEGAMPTIFSYGHRNPQGIALHEVTGEIWTHEHGPKGGDEINIIKKAGNYGWPEITFGINYDGTIITNDTARDGMEQPLIYWVPSIAPCGMDFVEGNIYPGWEGNLLIGSLSIMYLVRCEIKNNEVIHQEKLLEGIGRVRNVKMGPDGYIYVATESPGRIIKIIMLKAF